MRGRKRVLSLEEKGSLRPEMGKAAFPLGFRKVYNSTSQEVKAGSRVSCHAKR